MDRKDDKVSDIRKNNTHVSKKANTKCIPKAIAVALIYTVGQVTCIKTPGCGNLPAHVEVTLPRVHSSSLYEGRTGLALEHLS